jgi:hypothetical protein
LSKSQVEVIIATERSQAIAACTTITPEAVGGLAGLEATTAGVSFDRA